MLQLLCKSFILRARKWLCSIRNSKSTMAPENTNSSCLYLITVHYLNLTWKVLFSKYSITYSLCYHLLIFFLLCIPKQFSGVLFLKVFRALQKSYPIWIIPYFIHSKKTKWRMTESLILGKISFSNAEETRQAYLAGFHTSASWRKIVVAAIQTSTANESSV